jgi:hypothetical protein
MQADLDRFMRHLERRHPNRSTKKHYTSDLNIFAQFVGDKSPRKITVKDVDAFVADQNFAALRY